MIEHIPYMRGALVAEYAIGGLTSVSLDPEGWYPVTAVLEDIGRDVARHLRVQVMQGSRAMYCRIPGTVYDMLPRGQYLTE